MCSVIQAHVPPATSVFLQSAIVGSKHSVCLAKFRSELSLHAPSPVSKSKIVESMSASKHATKDHALHASSLSPKLVSAAKKNNNLFVERLYLVRNFATQVNAPLAVATQAVCFTAPQATTKLKS